jgi:small nuclear ribonucleoprotein (snRNP)-like protein
MDWQSILANLVVSGIITILLILVNWAVNAWEQRSTWGRWRQVFLRYPQILSFYTEVENKKDEILNRGLTERGPTLGGVLFGLFSILIVFEIFIVPFLISSRNLDPNKGYSLLSALFLLMQTFSLPRILSEILDRDNHRDDLFQEYYGFRLVTYAVYGAAVGIFIANLGHSLSDSEVMNMLIMEIVIVGITMVSNKRAENFVFSSLWNGAIKDESFTGFSCMLVNLKSGREVKGRLIDFMDKSGLVLKHGQEYLHVPWNEIEMIHILGLELKENQKSSQNLREA